MKTLNGRLLYPPSMVDSQDLSEKEEYVIEELEKGRLGPKVYEYLSDLSDEGYLRPEVVRVWEQAREDHDLKAYAPDHIYSELNEEVQEVKAEFGTPEIEMSGGENVVFLLGAGASAASGIPTVGKLLPRLLERAEQIGREDLDNLVDFCNGKEIDNIENLLTAAYISDFASTGRDITDLVYYFLFSEGNDIPEELPRPDVTSVNFLQETLQTLFGLLTSTMISEGPNDTHKAIKDLIKTDTNVSIITTNYDCCMDEELINSDVDFSTSLEDSKSQKESDVDLLKMHGSINWSYCESCQNVGQFDFTRMKEDFQNDRQNIAVVGICPHCDGRRRQLLVPPISFKFLMFPPLINIWNEARDKIIEADYIIAVGYSFADADAYISKIISSAMEADRDKEIMIVNKNFDVTKSLQEQYKRQIANFETDRVHHVHGLSQNKVPELVANMTSDGEIEIETKVDED